jgi:hypothetical protein
MQYQERFSKCCHVTYEQLEGFSQAAKTEKNFMGTAML